MITPAETAAFVSAPASLSPIQVLHYTDWNIRALSLSPKQGQSVVPRCPNGQL